MTVLLQLLAALLEYIDLLNGILQSPDFLTVKALISSQNASIIPGSYTYLLCLKLCQHNRRIPTCGTGDISFTQFFKIYGEILYDQILNK